MDDTLPDQTATDIPRGIALVEAIEAECARQGIEPRDVCVRFELQPSYWAAIIARNRSIQGLARRRLQNVADFLGKALIEVMSLAELVEPADFVVRTSLGEQLNAAFLKFRGDPMWAPLAPKPESWDRAPQDLKVAFVFLYERLCGEELLAKASIRSTVMVEPPPEVQPEPVNTKKVAKAPKTSTSKATARKSSVRAKAAA